MHSLKKDFYKPPPGLPTEPPIESQRAVAEIIEANFPSTGRIPDILFKRSDENWIASRKTVTLIRSKADLLHIARPLVDPTRIGVLRALDPNNCRMLPHYTGHLTFFSKQKRRILLEPASRLWLDDKTGFIGDVLLLWSGHFSQSLEKSVVDLAKLLGVDVDYENFVADEPWEPYGYSCYRVIEDLRRL